MSSGWRGAIVLFALLLAGSLLVPAPTLVVTSPRGSIDFCRSVSHDDTVELIFTNSLYGGEVRESFRIENGQLVRTHFITEHAAAAEYYAWNAVITQTDLGFEVLVPPRSFDELLVMVDATGNYRLVIRDESILLSARIATPEQIRIRVKTMPLLWRFVAGC